MAENVAADEKILMAKGLYHALKKFQILKTNPALSLVPVGLPEQLV